MIKTILCCAFLVFDVLFVTPFGLIAALLNLLGLRKAMEFFMLCIEVFWSRLLIRVVGCRVIVSGRENIPRNGGVCFFSNHCGLFDIVLLLAYSGRVTGFIAKRELAFIPVLNLWICMLGGLYIDRKNPRSALKTISRGIEKIKNGSAMIIFPEGHRSRGQGLLPFRPGALKLATQAEAVIVPVALTGTYELFEKNYRVNTDNPLKITFCKPVNTIDIPPADRKQALSDQIYTVIREELERN